WQTCMPYGDLPTWTSSLRGSSASYHRLSNGANKLGQPITGPTVIPAKTGIQFYQWVMDPGFPLRYGRNHKFRGRRAFFSILLGASSRAVSLDYQRNRWPRIRRSRHVCAQTHYLDNECKPDPKAEVSLPAEPLLLNSPFSKNL